MPLKIMRILQIVSAAFMLASLSEAQPQQRLNLMPMPSLIEPGVGLVPVNRSFSFAITGFKDALLERGVKRFLGDLSRQTGMLLKQKPDLSSNNPTLLIHADHSGER